MALVDAITSFAKDNVVVTLILGALLALYIYCNNDFGKSNLPPRFNYIVNTLSGKYEMEKKGPVVFLTEGYKQHGPVYRIKVFGQGVTVLIGPEANKFMYNTSDKILTAREPYHFTVPVFGPNIVYDAPLALMQRQLSFLRHALNGKNMQSYVNKVLQECDVFFSRFAEKGEMNLHKAFSELIINTASRCLMGEEVRETMHEKVADLYEALNDGMTRLSLLFPYSPHPKHKARDEARQEMINLFSPILDRRRENLKNGIENPKDFLQELVEARYENRREMTNEEIVGLLIACLFAGQHTSNITATWLGCMIAANKKDVLPRVLKEQVDIVGANFQDGDFLDYEAVQQMEYLHFSIKEVLRMFPPIVVMMRKVQEDQEFMGYTIPAGDYVVSSPAVSHRLENVFKNPDKFDPDRFLPPRSEGEDIIDTDGNITKQWKFIAFGEGRHQCIGRDFAFLQVKTIYSYIMRHFDFELVSPMNPVQNFDHLVAGPGCDTNVKFVRKNLVKEFAENLKK